MQKLTTTAAESPQALRTEPRQTLVDVRSVGFQYPTSEHPVLEGVELGYEEPVTLENAVLGRRVKVQGGFVKDSVLLDGCEVRQGFHAREGCLLEEDSYFAHTVGLKMTIVFPFVVLGSLINFCDCLLAGGTSRKHHSEVGSGFIHFNFSPRGDKATPSAFGPLQRGQSAAGAFFVVRRRPVPASSVNARGARTSMAPARVARPVRTRPISTPPVSACSP